MSAGTISIYQDADQSLLFHFKNSDGSDTNITGKTVTFYAARGLGQPWLFDPIVMTSHSDPTHGKTYVPITASQSNAVARGYRWEAWLDNTPTDMGTFIIKDTLRGSA